jgi:uncharacterized membrane protein
MGIGAFLRIFRIGHQSLWIDESISLQMAGWASGEEFYRGLLRDIHGPFTSLLLHCWIQWGESEAWMRLLYAVPAIATIPLVMSLGSALGGVWTARISGTILALSPFHVWYSQEIRNYSWAILWATAALLLFVKAWDAPRRTLTFAALGAFLALGVLTNFSLVLLLAALTFLAAARRPFAPRFALSWAGVLLGVGIVFLPWFADWYGRIGGERIFVDAPSPTGMPLREASGFPVLGVPYAFWTFAFGYSLGPPLQQLHLDRSWNALLPHVPVLILGFLAVGTGFLLGLRELAARGRLFLVAALLIIPLLLVIVLSSREVKTFHPRYLIASFPVFIVVLAAGWSRAGLLSRASAVLAFVLALVALGNLYFDSRYAKEDSRCAARFILQREEPGDSVVVIYSYRPFQHYFEKGNGKARVLRLHKRFLRTGEDLRAHVAEAASGDGRVWLVLSRWWDVAPEGRIRSAFEETLTERERWECPGIKVTLYEGTS